MGRFSSTFALGTIHPRGPLRRPLAYGAPRDLVVTIVTTMLILGGSVPTAALPSLENGKVGDELTQHIQSGPGYPKGYRTLKRGKKRGKEGLTQHIQSRPGYPKGYRILKTSKEHISQHEQQKPGYPKGYKQTKVLGANEGEDLKVTLSNADNDSGQGQKDHDFVRLGDPRVYLTWMETPNMQPDPKIGSEEPGDGQEESQQEPQAHPQLSNENLSAIDPKLVEKIAKQLVGQIAKQLLGIAKQQQSMTSGHAEKPNKDNRTRSIKGNAPHLMPKYESHRSQEVDNLPNSGVNAKLTKISRNQHQLKSFKTLKECKAKKLEDEATEDMRKAEATKDKAEKLEEKAQEEHKKAEKWEDKAEKQDKIAEEEKKKVHKMEEKAKEYLENAKGHEGEAKEKEEKAESLEEKAEKLEQKADLLQEKAAGYRKMIEMVEVFLEEEEEEENEVEEEEKVEDEQEQKEALKSPDKETSSPFLRFYRNLATSKDAEVEESKSPEEPMESRVEYLEEPVEYEKPKSLEEALDSRVESLEEPVQSQMPERKESDSIDEIKLAEAISTLLDITKENLKKLYESNSSFYSRPHDSKQILNAGTNLGKGPDSLVSRLGQS